MFSDFLKAKDDAASAARSRTSVLRRCALASRVLFCSTHGLGKIDAVLHADKENSGSKNWSHTCFDHAETAAWMHDQAEDSVSKRIVGRITQNLHNTRETTERAVLAIGDEISTLFDIAVNNNEAVTQSLRSVVGNQDAMQSDGSEEPTIRELIESIRHSIDRFVQNAQAYFSQQTQNAEESWARFESVANSVSEIEDIAESSKVLAINAKIESARLGSVGGAFAVVSNHLSTFSDTIQGASTMISDATRLMRTSMQQSRDAALTVEKELGDFSRQLVNEVVGVEGRTTAMTESMLETLGQMTASGNEMIEHSRSALSELQFQDPMVQGLKRTEHEVHKLHKLLETGSCDDIELPDIDDVVGRDGTVERDPGEVELF